MVCTLVCMLGRISSGFSQLCGFHDDTQHSLRVRLLVGGFECLRVLPAACRRYVDIRKMLPLGHPLPAIGVPEAPLLWLEPRERFPLS